MKLADSRLGVLIFAATVLVAGASAWALVFGRDHHHGQWQTQLRAVQPLSAAERDRVEALAKSICATCHGAALTGGVGPSLTGIGNRRSLARIERILVQGKGKNKSVSMPSGLVSEADAALLARWLATR